MFADWKSLKKNFNKLNKQVSTIIYFKVSELGFSVLAVITFPIFVENYSRFETNESSRGVWVIQERVNRLFLSFD